MSTALSPNLTADHLRLYRQCGYVLLPPEFLAEDAFAGALAALPRIRQQGGETSVLESDKRTVRSTYGIHRTSLAMARIARYPAVVDAVQQILEDSRVYVHQSKVNFKAPFSGEQWGWHQDYIYWLAEDNLPRPELVNVAVFADDVTPHNGPLTFIPGSHRHGVLSGQWRGAVADAYVDEPDWVSTLTSQEKFEIPPEAITSLAERYGMDAPTGPAGSVLLFHPNLLHASPPNMSPFGRAMIMFVFNTVANRQPQQASQRPWFLADAYSEADITTASTQAV